MEHHVNKLLFNGSEKNILVLFLQFLWTFEIVLHTHTQTHTHSSCLEYYYLVSQRRKGTKEAQGRRDKENNFFTPGKWPEANMKASFQEISLGVSERRRQYGTG